jgi:6-pyruvoyltetrahydropterin/6-carboxytetrahydropterin synthase
MKYLVSQRFYFEAAHTLKREFETDASMRVHGHTYHARFSVMGQPDPKTGMVADLALLRQAAERIKAQLDHRLLDDVPGLRFPTLEGLCAYMANMLSEFALPVSSVEVWREASGDSCTLDLQTA